MDFSKTKSVLGARGLFSHHLPLYLDKDLSAFRIDVTRHNLLPAMLRSAALLLVFAAHAHCEPGYRAIVSPYMTWADAKDSCIAQGGSLASLVPGHLSMVQTLSCLEFAWVGATDAVTEGTFLWQDGTTLPSTDIMWGAGQPGATEGIYTGHEGCVVLGWVGDPEKLHDVPCDQYFPFVCKIAGSNTNEIATVESKTTTSATILSSCDGDTFYRAIHSKMTHTDAAASCGLQGGTLANIPTSANARRMASLKCGWSYWVGLTDSETEGTWTNPDGTTVIEHSGLWQMGEPNSNAGRVDEDCAVIGFSSQVTLPPPSFTLHPTPYALHPKPYTLHPTPYTTNPKPQTLNPKPHPLRRGTVASTISRATRTTPPSFLSSARFPARRSTRRSPKPHRVT